MNKRLLALSVLTVGLTTFAWTQEGAVAAPAVFCAKNQSTANGCTANIVTVIQTRLRDYGYTITVDGDYGPQTTRVVMIWQRANGLAVDGITGPVTLRSLGLTGGSPPSGAPKIAPAPPSAPSGSVQDMIRAIWPAELHDWALAIAWRESNYKPGVTSSTGCCHGVFQIHEVHFSWMKNFGVTRVEQLFDAETNIRMAYELYKRNGKAPWNL